jgi:beta-N-acetylhexosaminidase
MTRFSETVGELFMVGYAGTDPAAAREPIQRHRAGGILLFTRNIIDAAHARTVCETLQEFRRQVSDSPLFIAIDQEGGCVARITEGVTVFPGNMALGAVGSVDLAYRAGAVTAVELAALGVNVNFAPVLDISSNPRNPGVGARSFGSDPQLVARLGSAMIRGMQANGVCATAKHFPGLGEARVDSHDELPVVEAEKIDLHERELLPFRAAIDAGVKFTMTAHCSYPVLDKTLTPATLSRPILSGLLRDEMGFGGIAITDCLEMAAIEKTFSAPQASMMAVQAGATMCLICHTPEKQIAAIEGLGHAAETGEIPEEKIESALAMIASVKQKLAGRQEVPADAGAPQTELSEAIAASAVTIVRNEGSLLPLRQDATRRLAVIVPAFEVLTKVEEDAEPHEVLLKELERRQPGLVYHTAPVEPGSAEVRACVEAANDADILLILTYNLHRYPAQAECVGALLELGKPAIVAAVRDPYDLAFVPKARACIATYGFRECSLRALAKALFGEVEARGTLPVTLA